MNLYKHFLGGFAFAPDDPAARGTADPAATDPASEAAPKTFDEAYVAKIRHEAAQHRTEKVELAKKLQAIEDSQKSELQKANDRTAALEVENAKIKSEAAATRSATAFRDAATEAGAKSPATIAKLLALESIKDADTGDPDSKALTAAIDALKKSDPDLFKLTGPTGRDASAGMGAASGAGKSSANSFFNDLIHGRR